MKVGREAVAVVLSGGTERAKAQRQGAWGGRLETRDRCGCSSLQSNLQVLARQADSNIDTEMLRKAR